MKKTIVNSLKRLAVRAVSSELVSGVKFPDIRENTGKIENIDRFRFLTRRNTKKIQWVTGGFP